MYSSKLSVGIHILCMVSLGVCPVTSDEIAGSIGTNPALVRRLMGKLKAARILRVQTGLGATGLAKPPEEISLLEVFRAVEPRRILFDIHGGTDIDCPVGAHIGGILGQLYDGMQKELEERLDQVKLSDLLTQFPQARSGQDTKTPPRAHKQGPGEA